MASTSPDAPEGDVPLALPEPLLKLKERAEAAGLTAHATEGWDDDLVWLVVEYPEGRSTRSITYDVDDVPRLEGVALGEVRFLPDLIGWVNTGTGEIESQIRVRNLTQIARIPGLEKIRDDEDASEEELGALQLPRLWRLEVEKSGVELEISPISGQFESILGLRSLRRVTLKIRGLKHSSTEGTVEALRSYSDSFFFDLDARYGVTLDLASTPTRATRSAAGRISAPPEFPTNKYLAQPTALYRYGRSATGLPLLSFLAYYQVLEFFFPIFTQEDVAKRVHQVLNNPRFDASDGMSVVKLIEAIKPGIRFGLSEREQLRTTVRRCIGHEDIVGFIASSKGITEHLCGRTQVLPGLQPLRVDGANTDLRDQVADRIYDIRCRIVHTKSDGGEGGFELLLPTGPEARTLGPDIELVRVVAQEAIIAGASRLDV